MKKLTLIFSLLASSPVIYSQQAIFSKAQSEMKESGTDTICYKTITMTGIPAISSPLTVTIAYVDLNATRNGDYDFLSGMGAGSRTVTTTNNQITIGVVIKSDPYNHEGDEQFILRYSFDSLGTAKTITDTVTIHDRNYTQSPPERFPADTTKMKVRIVTGSNFDFFDTPTFKNFAGDLNIFLPNVIKALFPKGKGLSNRPIGLNAGIFNYRYFESDSSGAARATETYLLDPTTTALVVGSTKYVRDNYYISPKTTYNNWGLYLNPMIELSSGKWYDMFVELHLETIWRTQIQTSSQSTIRKDTLVLTANNTRNIQESKALRPFYSKSTYFDYYYGVGLPTKFYVGKAFEFFVSPSIGFASATRTVADTVPVSRTTSSTSSTSLYAISYRNQTTVRPYYLAKFQLTTTLSPIDISLGGELRRVPGIQTFIAMYLGAALSLDKLKR